MIFANAQEWPYAILYLTGNRNFTVSLRLRAKKLGFKLGNFEMTTVSRMGTDVRS